MGIFGRKETVGFLCFPKEDVMLLRHLGHHSSPGLIQRVSNSSHRGLGNSFRENGQTSNSYSVQYILPFKKSFFPPCVAKHVYF